MKTYTKILVLISHILLCSYTNIKLIDQTDFGNGTTNLTLTNNLNITSGQSYEYDNLTINIGGSITILPDNNPSTETATIIKVKNNLIINGSIFGQNGTYETHNSNTNLNNGINFKKRLIQNNGGNSSDGNGVNGYTTSSIVETCVSSTFGGYVGPPPCFTAAAWWTFYTNNGTYNHPDYINNCEPPDVYGRYYCHPESKIYSYNRGIKGSHGNLVIIMAKNISGNGAINLQGQNGTTGSTNCSEIQPSSSGAGGNGGFIGFFYNSNSFNGTINTNNGLGGSGCIPGSNGNVGSVLIFN